MWPFSRRAPRVRLIDCDHKYYIRRIHYYCGTYLTKYLGHLLVLENGGRVKGLNYVHQWEWHDDPYGVYELLKEDNDG